MPTSRIHVSAAGDHVLKSRNVVVTGGYGDGPGRFIREHVAYVVSGSGGLRASCANEDADDSGREWTYFQGLAP